VTFEELLVKYIYQNKKLSLEGFGTVTLTSAVPDAEMIHKNRHIPVEGLSFEHNFRTTTDDNFVAFFAQQKGKIKPLAMSDIESHLQLARQLLNIGNPYIVDGIGSFEKQNNGSVLLVPGFYAVPFSDNTALPGRLKERAEAPPERRRGEEPEAGSGGLSNNVKRALILVLTILIVAVAGWFIWSKFVGDPASNTTPVTPSSDTVSVLPAGLIPATDTNAAVQQTSATAIPKWKAYFRQITEKQDALKKFKMYAGNKTVMMETADSVTFKLYVLIESPVADTARKVDSLSKFFARSVRIEPAN
jgi:hypothetical protein